MIRRVDTECHGTIVRKGTDAFSEQMNKAVIRWCGQRKSRKVFHVVRQYMLWHRSCNPMML